jgi:hypothetical protein
VKKALFCLGFALTVFWCTNIPWDRVWKGQNDFLALYTGGKLLGTDGLRDDARTEAVHRGAVGDYYPLIFFSRPDYYAFAFKPLSYLPYRAAYAVFQVVNLAAAVVFVLLSGRRSILALSLVSIPLATAILNGQDLPLVLAALLGAYELDRRGKGYLAGALLAFCSVKFHLFLFVPLAILAFRKWKMLAGGAAALGAGSLAAGFVQGWDWPLRYAAKMLRKDVHPEPFHFLNLRDLAITFANSNQTVEFVLGGLAAVLLIAFLWQVHRDPTAFPFALSLAIVGGVLISFHLGVHDCAVLLGAVALAPVHHLLEKGLTAICSPPVYLVLLLDGWRGALPALVLLGIFVAVVIQQYWPRTRTAIAAPAAPAKA